MPNEDKDFLSELETLDLDNKDVAKSESSVEANTAKVTLDLDDAPFLEQQPAAKQEEASKSEPEKVSMSTPDSTSKQLDGTTKDNGKRKKIIIIAASGIVLLLVIGALLFFFLGGEDKKAPAEPKPVEKATPAKDAPPKGEAKKHSVNATAAPAEPVISLMDWEPFVIEKKDRDGKIVFLYTKFTVATEDQKLLGEMNSKKIILRDAIFFYLENKDLIYLSDPNTVASLKKELLNVINEKLQHGELKDILIENYLIK